MRLSWLCEQDASWIMLILAVAMILAAEFGYRAGLWRQPRSEGAARDHFGAIRNSLLGLLTLLLAFSFGMSAQRYETRRQLVIEDATPLRGLYLRSTLLPDSQRGQFKKLLRQYVDQRADPNLIHRDVSADEVAQAVARSESLQGQMWELVRAMAQQDPPAKVADEMLKLLIESSTVNSKRVQAFVTRVPDPIVWLLLGTAVTCMAAVGFSGGLSKHRGILATVLFSLAVCVTIFVILELDRPAKGILRADQGPMIQLKQLVDRDSEAHQ